MCVIFFQQKEGRRSGAVAKGIHILDIGIAKLYKKLFEQRVFYVFVKKCANAKKAVKILS